MSYRLEQVANQLLRAVNNMDRHEWLIISTIAVVVGAMFLRGYGSRTNY